MKLEQALYPVYRRLYACFGPQHWWPARTRFEVIVGAILTQNTSWGNVEKALCNLKSSRALTVQGLRRLSLSRLAALIRPAGYYNIKALRLRNFLDFLFTRYGGSLRRLARQDTVVLREELLAVNGIGAETADSILLYGFARPVFVIDAYTKRILARHGFCRPDVPYEELQRVFVRALRPQPRLFNEYHALLVRLGKEFCLKSYCRCEECPLAEPRFGYRKPRTRHS